LAPVQTRTEANPASCTMGTGSFPGLRRKGWGVDHSPPSSAEVKEILKLYLYSPSVPSWQVTCCTSQTATVLSDMNIWMCLYYCNAPRKFVSRVSFVTCAVSTLLHCLQLVFWHLAYMSACRQLSLTRETYRHAVSNSTENKHICIRTFYCINKLTARH